METLTNILEPPKQTPLANVSGQRFIPDSDGLLVALDDPEERTKGGIIIPDAYKKKVQTGTIVEVGEGRWDPIGNKRVPMTKKVGDRILLSRMAGTPLVLDDHEVLLTNEREILGTFHPRKEGEKLLIDDLPSAKAVQEKRKAEMKANPPAPEKKLILPTEGGKKEDPAPDEKRISLVGGEIPTLAPADPNVVVAKPKRTIKCNFGGCANELEAPSEASAAEVRKVADSLKWAMPLGFPVNTGLCPEHSGKK